MPTKFSSMAAARAAGPTLAYLRQTIKFDHHRHGQAGAADCWFSGWALQRRAKARSSTEFRRSSPSGGTRAGIHVAQAMVHTLLAAIVIACTDGGSFEHRIERGADGALGGCKLSKEANAKGAPRALRYHDPYFARAYAWAGTSMDLRRSLI